MLYYALIFIICVNVVTLFVYGLDKLKAMRQWRRVPESTHLLLAFFGGSLGALMGMTLFRHKTQHKAFTIGVPLILLLHLALVGWFVWEYHSQL